MTDKRANREAEPEGSEAWEQRLRRELDERGDAFEALLRYYQPRIQRLVQRWVSRREEAMELTQDTLLHAFRSRHRYDPARPFRPWIFQIAVNLCRNHIRAASRRELVGPGTEPTAGIWNPAPPDAEQHTLHHEERRLVEAGLARLDEDERTLLLLRFTEDMSYAELEGVFDRPTTVLKMRVHRALRRLRVVTEELMQ